MSYRVAIVGGGPGGLMTAYQLQQRSTAAFETTIYEASGRLGGKVLTRQFDHAPVLYEAGAAELYDYSHVGEDPLRELVEEFGFHVQPMQGAAVVQQDQVLHGFEDVGRLFGDPTRRALEAFDAMAHRWSTAEEFYDSDWRDANADAKLRRSFEDELALIPDEAARQYLRMLVHSDLATEPHRTSASYGLQNYLMNDPDYLRLYTIDGGIEQLMRALAARVTARLRMNEAVTCVTRVGERLQVTSRRDGVLVREEFDFVVAALPRIHLYCIDWRGGGLEAAMRRHNAHYDYPAHYLRVSVLFRKVFWREHLKDSYVMLEAFGGCCLYDEGSRTECGEYGVLGWLLAGDAAMRASNLGDAELLQAVMEALPSFMPGAKELFVEGHVHRWIGEVNGMPGGRPVEDMETRHIPEHARPNVLLVGDYLFDSTLNGVLDSADFVAETLAESMAAGSLGAVDGVLSVTP